MRRFGGEHYHAYSAALSPGGGTLAAGGGDGVIRLWDVGTGKELRQLRGHLGRHGGGVTALAWSSDGRTLFSGGVDTTILVWRFAPSE
jgi:WD40 repeat protein